MKNNEERIESIREKSKGQPWASDVLFLMGIIEEKSETVRKLEQKNSVLGQQVLELTEAMENIKSDFGGFR